MENPAVDFEQINRLRAEGNLAEAERLAREFAAARPDNADLQSLLAMICVDTGRYDEALVFFRLAAAIEPQSLPHVQNLALIHTVLGQSADAENAFRDCLAIQPGHAAVLDGLGTALQSQGRLDEAIDAFKQSIAANPKAANTWYNLGNAYYNRLRPEDAVNAYNNAILLQPTFAGAHLNRGNALRELGRLEDAIGAFRSARVLEPGNMLASSNMLITLPFLSGIDPDEQLNEFSVIGRRMAERAKARRRPHANSRDPERKLRIGYLSPNFRNHAMARSMLPLIRAQHRQGVHVHIFAHEPRPDDVTAEFQAASSDFTFINAMGDDAAAEAVRQAGIDILLHCMGHWADNRLEVLAEKPAPVQVSYLCNSPTTGLPTIDYLMTDHVLGPSDHLAVIIPETPVYLESGFSVRDYGPDIAIGPPPSTQGHPLTFASFNNPQKISHDCVALWAEVLKAVPESRMAIKGLNLQDKAANGGLAEKFAACGIDPSRLLMMGQLATYEQHLDAFNSVDVALDTTPFSGGDTTLDAIWMGVPVVTLVGPLMFGRYSLGHLTRVGAPELAAATPEAYVELAAALARDTSRLAKYRRDLRPMMRASSLLDADGHARELDLAFRAMWRRWCESGAA